MAVKQLTASEGTKYRVNTIVHYVVCADWRQRVTLSTNQSSRLFATAFKHAALTFPTPNISVPMQLIIFKDLSLKRHHLPSGILTLACSCDISKIKFFSTNEINPLKK